MAKFERDFGPPKGPFKGKVEMGWSRESAVFLCVKERGSLVLWNGSVKGDLSRR